MDLLSSLTAPESNSSTDACSALARQRIVSKLGGFSQPAEIHLLHDRRKRKDSRDGTVPKKDFYSHRVPPGVYNGSKSMEVCSLRLCRILADLYAWDLDASYRVPGTIIQRKNIAMFYLDEAEVIEHDEMFMYKE